GALEGHAGAVVKPRGREGVSCLVLSCLVFSFMLPIVRREGREGWFLWRSHLACSSLSPHSSLCELESWALCHTPHVAPGIQTPSMFRGCCSRNDGWCDVRLNLREPGYRLFFLAANVDVSSSMVHNNEIKRPLIVVG
ncbi:unnamed protein product, partial [Scytosiphon promiscuus]